MIRRTGAPRDTLAARLRTLVGAGILERSQYAEHPARFEYRLTEAGRDLYPVIVTLMSWGDRHLDDGSGPPSASPPTGNPRAAPQKFVPRACPWRAVEFVVLVTSRTSEPRKRYVSEPMVNDQEEHRRHHPVRRGPGSR
jgi:hypothetical protein